MVYSSAFIGLLHWRVTVCKGKYAFCLSSPWSGLQIPLKGIEQGSIAGPFLCEPIKELLIKVTGDSLLIHAFAYSLFIGLCSVSSNMTGYFHSYHSIKLICCGSPQRDVLSDKMVLWVVTQFLFHALPFCIKYCCKLCIQSKMVVRWKHVSYLLYGKYF